MTQEPAAWQRRDVEFHQHWLPEVEAMESTGYLYESSPMWGDAKARATAEALVAALQQQCAGIDQVRKPDASRVAAYEQRLQQYAGLRGGGLYYPYLSSGRGQGPFVELTDGSVKLDMITGIGVHGLGHNHPELVRAGLAASMMGTVQQGNLQQFDASVSLCQALVDLATAHGAGIEHVTLSTSGAMANENALKLAFHARPGRGRILAFERCFAGRTLGLSQLTDKAAYRVGLPPTLVVDYLPFDSAEDPQARLTETLQRMDSYLSRHPQQHAALWLELVQGEGGYNVGSREFLVRVAQVAREHDIPIIFDEVQTFGRTSQPFAFQHFQLDEYADIVTIGKVTQVCATLYRPEFCPGPGLISQTFTAGTWEILAADVVIKTLMSQGHYGPTGRNMQLHQRFAEGLDKIASRHQGIITGPWGIGGMIALTPLDGTPEQAKGLAQACFDAGLLCFVAGADPARVRFLPPLAVCEDRHIELALEILESCLVRLADEKV